MKKKLLPLVFLLAAFAGYAQNAGFPTYQGANPGFPYNADAPVFNSDYDTVPSVKKITRLLNILSEFRIQAYVQPEWQYSSSQGGNNAGAVGGLSQVQGGGFPKFADNRFILRRGRFKLSYEHKNAKDLKVMEFAFQFDASEKGFNALKDAYGKIIDPWTGWFGLQGGVFLRPFGFESPAPPAFHESPEFSRVNQTIMPNECELGEALVIESPAKFQKVYLRLDASLVNGEGVGVNSTQPAGGANQGTYQSRKDFVGRIKVGKSWDLKGGASQKGGSTLGLNASASYYNGGVLQFGNVYTLQNGSFKNITTTHADSVNNINKTDYKREYYGAHLELKADYYIGTTTLRGEFIGGQQPGTLGSSQAPIGSATNVYVPTAALDGIYVRKFTGLMLYCTQSFKNHMRDGHIMYHDITFKYDVYDPNTGVKGTQIATGSGLSATDMKYTTLGFGYSIIPYNFCKVMIWYDYVINEKTGLANLTGNFKGDNVLTIRTQFYIDTKWFGGKSKYRDNLMAKQY